MKKVFDQTVRDLYVISVLYPPSYTLCAIAGIIFVCYPLGLT
jgi:hypothetical protein